jgi:hypothetical protein
LSSPSPSTVLGSISRARSMLGGALGQVSGMGSKSNVYVHVSRKYIEWYIKLWAPS